MAVESAIVKGPSRGLQAAGAALIVISTVAIAIVPTFAKLAFDGGSNTLTIITGRSILSILITFLLILALRRPLRIAKRPLLISLAMGVDYAVMLYGYVGAVEYLPVNMVILIYFIHPLLVGFVIMYLGQEGLTLISVVALAAALAGLGLAVGFSFVRLNLTGLGLAAMAMVTAAIYIVGNARAVQEAPGLTVAFYMMLSAAIALAILFLFFGTLALPTTELAWMGITGVAVASTAGTLTFLCGMAYVGAARAAMISNLEPVLGVLFAMTVLGERVTPLQGTGIALVLGSIVAMELRR
jgi:drug/metabolite transporter (DMT)-like permease